MKNYLAILLPCLSLLAISSCTTPQYALSPLNTISNPYIPLPSKGKTDENKTESFVGLSISPGVSESGNSDADIVNAATLRLVQSHALGSFRIGYGGNLMLGGVNVGESWDDFEPGGAYRNIHRGGQFFGAAGLNTKMSFVAQGANSRTEWRFLGLEGSAHYEFGDFMTFRKNYPRSENYYVNRDEWTFTAGIFTEFVTRKKNDKQFGFKFGFSLQTLPSLFYLNDRYEDDDFDNDPPAIPHYFNFAFFFGQRKARVFIQPNIGTATFNMQFGFLYKLN
jgi:hypothetical protein